MRVPGGAGHLGCRRGAGRLEPRRHRLPPPPRRGAGLEWNLPGAAGGRPGLVAARQVTCREAPGAGSVCCVGSARQQLGVGGPRRFPCRCSRARWCRCCAAGRRWPPAGSCSAPGGSSCWFCWASSSTSTRLSSSKTSRPRRQTSTGKGRRRSTSSTTKSATTASSRPASTSSWGASRSAKCGSTSGRSTWSAEDSSRPHPPARSPPPLVVAASPPPSQSSLLYLFCLALDLGHGTLVWALSATTPCPPVPFCLLHLQAWGGGGVCLFLGGGCCPV